MKSRIAVFAVAIVIGCGGNLWAIPGWAWEGSVLASPGDSGHARAIAPSNAPAMAICPSKVLAGFLNTDGNGNGIVRSVEAPNMAWPSPGQFYPDILASYDPWVVASPPCVAFTRNRKVAIWTIDDADDPYVYSFNGPISQNGNWEEGPDGGGWGQGGWGQILFLDI